MFVYFCGISEYFKMNCKLKHWGDYEDGSDKKKEVQPDEIILTDDKTNLMLNIHNPGRRLKPIR